MQYRNLNFDQYNFENNLFSLKKTNYFLLSIFVHSAILFFFTTFTLNKVNYGISLPASTFESSSLELVAHRPQVLESPKVEQLLPEIQEIKEKEFIIPKEVKTKTKKIEKIIPLNTTNKVLESNNNLTSQNSTISVEVKNDLNNFEQKNVVTQKITDLSAAYLRNPPPPYPQGSRISKEEGLVLLLVSIDSSGEVSDISIKETSGFSRLDRSALQAVSRWVFKPTTYGGIAVSDKVEVPIRFELTSK